MNTHQSGKKVVKNMNPVETLKQLVEFPTYQVSPDKVEDGMKDCAFFLSETGKLSRIYVRLGRESV